VVVLHRQISATPSFRCISSGDAAPPYHWRLCFHLAEKQRAQRRFTDVRQLASSFLFDIEGQLHDLPGATKAREMVVTSALTYLNRLAPDAGGDRNLLEEIALAYEKTAIVQGWPPAPNLGHLRDALDTFAKAVAIWEKLLAVHPADANAALHLSTCLSETADVQRGLRQYRDAELSSRRAGEFAAIALQQQPSDFTSQRAVAQSLRGRGMAVMAQGDAASAVTLLRQAVDTIGQYHGPKIQLASYEYATLLSNLGVALERRGELQEALNALTRAREIYDTDLVGWSGRAGLERNRMGVYRSIGNLLGARDRPNLGRPVEAMAEYQHALDLATTAYRADPNNALAREDYALSIGKIADLVAGSDPERSIRLSDQALAILRHGSSIDESNLDLGYYLSVAQPLRVLGRTRESLDRLKDALAILQRMRKAAPADPFLQTSLANIYQSTGQTQRSAGQSSAAFENFRRAAAIIEPMAQGRPEDLNLQTQLAGIYDDLGWREKSQAVWRGWLKRSPNSEYAQSQLRLLTPH
jgi:tetratricopeptide (TPR) repeat protein